MTIIDNFWDEILGLVNQTKEELAKLEKYRASEIAKVEHMIITTTLGQVLQEHKSNPNDSNNIFSKIKNYPNDHHKKPIDIAKSNLISKLTSLAGENNVEDEF